MNAVINVLFSQNAGNFLNSSKPVGFSRMTLLYGVSIINLLMPNVNYSGRTAPLTSKVAFYIFIQQIRVLNILNMVYTLRFFLFKMQFVS